MQQTYSNASKRERLQLQRSPGWAIPPLAFMHLGRVEWGKMPTLRENGSVTLSFKD